MVKICQHCQVESASTAYLCKGCGRVLRPPGTMTPTRKVPGRAVGDGTPRRGLGVESRLPAGYESAVPSRGNADEPSGSEPSIHSHQRVQSEPSNEPNVEADLVQNGGLDRPRFVAPVVPKKKNQALRRLLALGIAWVLVLVGVSFLYVHSMGRLDFYTLGEDQITSVKGVVGARHVYEWHRESHEWSWRLNLDYRVPREATRDVEAYSAFLVANEGFRVVEAPDFEQPTGVVVLWRESENPFEDVIVRIRYCESGYTLEFLKNRRSSELVPALDPGAESAITLRIEPVEGWTSVGGSTELEYSSDKGFFGIGVRYLPSGMTAKEYVEGVHQAASANSVERTSVTEMSEVSVVGFNGWEFFRTVGVVETRETFLHDGPRIYRVSCILMSKSSDEDYGQCTEMMESLTTS